MTKVALALAPATLAALLAGCGGGSGSGPAAYVAPTAAPTSASTSAPTSTPTNTPTSTPTTAATSTPTSAPTTAAASLATSTLNGSAGFVDGTGKTVYVFDADTSAGVSTCTGTCAAAWPPLVPSSTTWASPFSVITRSDGTKQLAFNGRPLYTYIADGAPGSVAGDGITSFGATWHIARPTTTALAVPTSSPTAPSVGTPY